MAERGAHTASQVDELKVSGHTMTLEPGLYCVFSAADGPVPSADTGLPGVRISQSPGPQPGTVSIVGFEAGGWIGPDAAALIRVSGDPAKVLVTVYQEPGARLEAPRLQVVRLSAEPAAPPAPVVQVPPPRAPAPRQPPAFAPAPVEVMAHVYGQGDVGGRLTDWMGEPGSSRWIEGFAIAPAGVPASDIEYQAVLGRGWLSPWAEGGQFCGSRGMSLPILGLRVKLRGASAETHRVQLVASFVDGTRVGPVHDGDACEAASLAALEAFQLSILPAQARPAPAPARTAPSRATAVKPAPKLAPGPAPKAARTPAPPPPPAAAKRPPTTRRR